MIIKYKTEKIKSSEIASTGSTASKAKADNDIRNTELVIANTLFKTLTNIFDLAVTALINSLLLFLQ
jgi:hypothetical protein